MRKPMRSRRSATPRIVAPSGILPRLSVSFSPLYLAPSFRDIEKLEIIIMIPPSRIRKLEREFKMKLFESILYKRDRRTVPEIRINNV